MFGCETVLQLSFAGLLYKKQVFLLLWELEASWTGTFRQKVGKSCFGPAGVRAGIGFNEPKKWLCLCGWWQHICDKLLCDAAETECYNQSVWNQSSPSHKHAWERRPSPVKKSNTDLPLAKNSLTCHFSEIIWETKLIPSCWFFLTASLPSKAILYFLFSHSLFFHTLSTGSSIISNNLYFLSLPSYCFVFSS